MTFNKLSLLKIKSGDGCLVDNAIMYSIIWEKKYFLELIKIEVKINTILHHVDLIEGFRRAIILLVSRTNLCIHNILYSNRFGRNLINFKDICQNFLLQI